MHAHNYTTEGTCTSQEHAQYIVVQSDCTIVYEKYSRYSQIGELYSADLSMRVYWQKLWNVYQHSMAQSVLANIPDSIDA